MKKQLYLIAGLAFFALALAFIYPQNSSAVDFNAQTSLEVAENAIIPQKIIATKDQEESVLSIYYQDRLLGVIHDREEYDAFLNRIYEEKYAADFPDSAVGLGEDIHISEARTYCEVEDKDEEIFAYIEENNLFSILGYKFEFSNGSIAYVKNQEDFIHAREDFVMNFLENDGVDPAETLNLLNRGTQPTTYSDDGYIDISYHYEDTAKVAREFVPLNRVLKSYEECMEWLCFGYDYEPKTYIVQEGDMVQGVAWLNSISVTNLIYVNYDILQSENQPLQVGMELNVTPIDSPLEIEVVKEHVFEQIAYPEDTLYKYDDTLQEGMQRIEQDYKTGTYRVMYRETYVNGVLDEERTEEVSRLMIEEPQQQIIVIGTKVIPSVGSGSFRYPVDNAIVTCDWGCYAGHTAVDFQNMYNRWGNVIAADRGVVTEVSYDPIGGWYVIINHNNGYYTYYGHMSSRAWVSVGQIVSKGEAIGPIGMTGVATGPHVHFEIRYGSGSYGNSIYPWPYMNG